MTEQYSKENLPKTLNWKEFIRKRPGMYIGDLGSTGCKVMIEYLLSELMEDAKENPCIEIELHKDFKLKFKITNVDTKKFCERIDKLENKEPPYDLALPVLISLSSEINIAIHDQPGVLVLFGKEGDYQMAASTSQERENNIYIDFVPDKSIFKDLDFAYETMNNFLRQFSYLNPSLKMISLDKTTNELQVNIFHNPTGIFRMMDLFIQGLNYANPSFRLDIEAQENGYSYRISICCTYIYVSDTYTRTFAGDLETYYGGSLEQGILEGIISALRSVAEKKKKALKINRRLVMSEVVIIAAVRGQPFEFEGATKRKLAVPVIRKTSKRLVSEKVESFLEKESKEALNFLSRFTE